MKRSLIIVLGLLLTLGLLSGTALANQRWGDIPEHGHFLLQKVDIETEEIIFIDGEPFLHLEFSFRRCVDLAAGRPLPNASHHNNVHMGTAGFMLDERAGHAVVPTVPLTHWENCADLLDEFPDREVELLIPLPPNGGEEEE